MSSTGSTGSLPEVKIRGKRMRKAVSESSDLDSGSRPRGRPLKRVAELATTRRREQPQRHRTRQQQISNMTTKGQNTQQLSTLERLPAELIEQVFFWSLEVNLIRACPYFAKVLSKESLYSSLILFAFFDDDGGVVEVTHFEPAQYYRLSINDKIRLQTDILDARWCTLERIKKCMPILSRLRMAQAWHHENDDRRSGGMNDFTELYTANALMQSVAALPDLHDEAALERHFWARAVIDVLMGGVSFAISREYLPRIRTWTVSQGKQGRFRKTVDASPSILGVRRIPDRLLRGSPWTTEKIDYLMFLRQGHRFICSDLALSISPNAMFQGMESAICESNWQALRVLMELHHAAFRLDRFTTDDFRPQRQLWTAPFTHPIPLKLFHLVAKRHVEYSMTPRILMSMLVREGIDSIPPDDPILTKWAIQASTHDCPVAKWLLKHMEGTEDYGLGSRDSPLFVNGAIMWRRNSREAPFPWPQQTFTEQLNYLTEQALAFIPELK